MTPRQSQRFDPPKWSGWVVPLLLGVLVLSLLATLAIILLALLGLTPGV